MSETVQELTYPPPAIQQLPPAFAQFYGELGDGFLYPFSIHTNVYSASLVVKSSPGLLFSITGYNSKASGQFIQIHDCSSLPADGAVPAIFFTVATVSNFSILFAAAPRAFTSGIVVCNSSTGPTKTIASADCWFDVQYL